MKYKSVEELKKMSLEEVAEYVDLLERTDEGAKNNSFEYQEWCGNDLSERLDGMSLEGWTEILWEIKKLRERGLVRYNELSEGAKKEAYNRFAWDFVNEKPNGKSHEEIMAELKKHWFDKNGATFLGTY